MECSAEEAADLVEDRINTTDEMEEHELLGLPEAKECIDQADEQITQQFRQKCEGLQEATALLMTAVRKVRETSSVRKIGKRAPVKFTAPAVWTAKAVEDFAPPGSKVYRDTFNGRWILFYGRAGGARGRRWSVSSSWGAAGKDDPCVAQIVKSAWQRHEQLTGESCPWPALLAP